MGEIYLGRRERPPQKGQLVALKILSSRAADDQDALAMFLDEAKIMARIVDPHVLQILDYGEIDGHHYIASEYLEGRPLVRVMIDSFQIEDGLDYIAIAAIGRDAALGLHAAHEAKTPSGEPLSVVHRDVSPQNIFVTYEGVSKVIDFGVARATERIAKTAVGIIKGKAAYMSPEQTRGFAVDGRSDVFSLAVCLWEMIAGRRLFKKNSEYETLRAVSNSMVDPPTSLRAAKNTELDRIILRALERNLSTRTPSALAFAEELEQFSETLGAKMPKVKGTAHPVIRELLERLYFDVRKQEHALIQSFEVREPTEYEVEALRKISGVGPKKFSRELTMVADPDSLVELEHFGEESASEVTQGSFQGTIEQDFVTDAVAPIAPLEQVALPQIVEANFSPQQFTSKAKASWKRILWALMVLFLGGILGLYFRPAENKNSTKNTQYISSVRVQNNAAFTGSIFNLAMWDSEPGHVELTLNQWNIPFKSSLYTIELLLPESEKIMLSRWARLHGAKNFIKPSKAQNIYWISSWPFVPSVVQASPDWRVLSVNDCLAHIEQNELVYPGGLRFKLSELELKDKKVSLLNSKEGNNKSILGVELVELGLIWGNTLTDKMPNCGTGLSSHELALRRVPKGEYSLRFIFSDGRSRIDKLSLLR